MTLVKYCKPFCIGILLFALIFIAGIGYGQGSKLTNDKFSSTNEIKELNVGSIVPDITINNIINYKSSSINLGSLRGSWVLIDFWGRTCTSCIAALPNFDSVRKQFNNLKVITVTDLESKRDVDAVLGRHKKTAGLRLPTVLKNGILKKYFPHEIISHVVWIDPHGVVQAITGSEYVTATNMAAIMKGKVNRPIKKDVLEFKSDMKIHSRIAMIIKPIPFSYLGLV